MIAFGTAAADTIVVNNAELKSEEENVVLNAEFDFAFNATLEEALQKGIALYFLFEFEIGRPRWYWFEEKIVEVQIPYRVSYNALTRQYRIASGLLSQQFDTLEDVTRRLSRVTARPVAKREALARGSRYEAQVRLRLDVNQLPKPFQLNALASRDWTMQSDWYRWNFAP